MRILCFSHDLPGHLDWGGFLVTAGSLSQRGHEVLWVSGQAVEANVRAAGLRFVAVPTTGWRRDLPPLPPSLSPAEREQARRARGLDVWLNSETVGAALSTLTGLAQEFRPEIILAEPFAAAGALLAEKLGLPLVVVGRPALDFSTSAGPATEVIRRLCQSAGVSGAYWDLARGTPRSPHLHVDFFCRGWYADLPDVAPQTVFCGGVRSGWSATSASGQPVEMEAHLPPSDRPLVLITLGSTFNRDDAFFRIAASAVLQAGAQPLVVIGRSAPRPPGLPDETWVREWVAYSAVFPRLAAIIHHGGIATTHAALVHGLPQIVTPHAGDQTPQAARVTQAGVGYGVWPSDFSAASAPTLVAQLLADRSFQVSAGWWAEEMQELGGVGRAVEAIEAM